MNNLKQSDTNNGRDLQTSRRIDNHQVRVATNTHSLKIITEINK